MSYNVERARVAHLPSWAWGQPLDRSPAVAGTESDVFTFLSCHPLKQSVLVGGNPLTPLSSVLSVSLRYRGRENFHGVVAFCLEVTTQSVSPTHLLLEVRRGTCLLKTYPASSQEPVSPSCLLSLSSLALCLFTLRCLIR